MSVGLLAVRLLYRFYVRVHLSKWFTFSLFMSVVSLLSCRSLRLHLTVYSLPKVGLSEHQPVKLPLMFIYCTFVSSTTSAPAFGKVLLAPVFISVSLSTRSFGNIFNFLNALNNVEKFIIGLVKILL